MSHYTEDELSAYALSPEAIPDGEAVEQHVAACHECRQTLDVIEAFDLALRDPLPWEAADSMPVRHEVPRQLIDHARAIAVADTYARDLVMPLVDSAIRFREARIDEDPRFFTLAVVRLLCKVANGTHERQPQFGLILADAALSIAAKIAETPGLPWCLGTAWKERANALRYLGRFRECDEALDRADEAFQSDEHVEAFDLAIVEYVRATLYGKTERFDDAVALARSAAATFHLYGDSRRYLSALLVEAVAYYGADRDMEASVRFERVAMLARQAEETGILSRALANAASSYARLREHAKAIAYYEEAIAVIDDLDLPTESARLRWAMAALKLEVGEFEESLAGLELSRLRLQHLGMVNDAALATLDLVAGLLVVERPERVPDLCRAISVSFSEEGMMRSAKKALAYLTEAVTSGEATPEDVRHVRAFLEHLPESPYGEFQQIQ